MKLVFIKDGKEVAFFGPVAAERVKNMGLSKMAFDLAVAGAAITADGGEYYFREN